MKELLKKYLIFVIGLYFLAAGIVLIIRSALGTTPISSVNYVLSLNSSLSLGTCTFIINMLLIIGQFWLIRNNKSKRDIIEILLQLPFSFIFSAFIDLNMLLTSGVHPSNYGMSIALLLIGCLVQSIGVVLEIKPHVAMMSAEGFVKYASRSCNKEFGKFKVYFDVSHVSRHPFPHLEPTCRRCAGRFHHRGLHNGLSGKLSEPKNHDTKNITQTSLHHHKITLQHGVLQYCQHPRNRDLQKR